MRARWRSIAFCIITFHSPDGTELFVQADTIRIVRPIVTDKHEGLVVKGINSIIYTGVRPNGFGIKEHPDEVIKAIKDCDYEKGEK